MLLKEMGLDHELVLVDRVTEEQKTKEYLELNPTGRIPTLVDGGRVIFESAAICMYLCDSHPQCNLIPSPNLPERAEFFQWLFYLVTTIQPELMLYFYPDKHTNQSVCAKSIIEIQEKRVTEMFALVDRQLDDKVYLVGNNLTVCDFFLFMLSHWAGGFKSSPLSFKFLGRYLRKLANRPAVIEASRIESTDLGAYK